MAEGLKEQIVELLGDLHLDIKSLGDSVDALKEKLDALDSHGSHEKVSDNSGGQENLRAELMQVHKALDTSHDCIRQKSNVLMTIVETESTEIMDNIVKKPDCH